MDERWQAKEYLAMKGQGNRSECMAIMKELVTLLKGFQQEYPGLAYLVRLLSDEEDVIDEMLRGDQIHSLIQDRYPILYLNVTYDSTNFDPCNLAELEAKYDLKLAYSEI
jgi:hypothetical protein